LLGTSRLTALLGSVLVALCSGTNYVYAIQLSSLGARLHLTHTQLNVVGLASNTSGYIAGPIVGRIVDAHGPWIPLIGAFVCCLTGYAWIKCMFDVGVAPGGTLLGAFFYACFVFVIHWLWRHWWSVFRHQYNSQFPHQWCVSSFHFPASTVGEHR
ncbi:hypothetical protein SCLCIDRAFT_1143213, partial [Scleroderma citrinum Foug A]